MRRHDGEPLPARLRRGIDLHAARFDEDLSPPVRDRFAGALDQIQRDLTQLRGIRLDDGQPASEPGAQRGARRKRIGQ